jgi:GT2 family glycosyltransferase
MLGPIRLVELELDEGVPALAADSRPTEALVRMHGRPLGIVKIEPLAEELPTHALETRIIDELGETILREPSLEDALREREAFRATAPFATVVVATRDRPNELAECLESLLQLEYPRYEIVVVDNAPRTDATAALVRERFAARGVRYVREGRPGLASAHNRGFDEANGWVIAFTDDDVIVDRLWLLELAHAFEAAPAVGCVTGLIMPLELETPTQVILERYSRLGKGFTRRVFDPRVRRSSTDMFPYAAGAFGSGANMAFSAEALRRVGGFDPATGTGTRARGGDDLAAFFSVVSAGYAIVYEPAAIIRHRHRRDPDLERQLFDYGAGLTAYLTKVVVDRPGRMLDIARRIPRGVAYALAKGSDRNAGWHDAVPPELIRAERRGMLYGPVGYFAARWRA